MAFITGPFTGKQIWARFDRPPALDDVPGVVIQLTIDLLFEPFRTVGIRKEAFFGHFVFPRAFSINDYTNPEVHTSYGQCELRSMFRTRLSPALPFRSLCPLCRYTLPSEEVRGVERGALHGFTSLDSALPVLLLPLLLRHCLNFSIHKLSSFSSKLPKKSRIVDLRKFWPQN